MATGDLSISDYDRYADSFPGSGLSLTKLADIPAMASVSEPKTILPEGGRFPRFMLLAFTRT